MELDLPDMPLLLHVGQYQKQTLVSEQLQSDGEQERHASQSQRHKR